MMTKTDLSTRTIEALFFTQMKNLTLKGVKKRWYI
jgi:hypothetical protein